MAQHRSRKRRGRRRRRAPVGAPAARGYARARRNDEAARAALEPLAQGERPRAVTVGALAAAGLALTNLVALALGYHPGESGKALAGVLGVLVLALVAWGMWRAHYWAVLGMQALLAITILFAAIGLMTAANLAALALIVAIIVPAGTLFWFLVKAMARMRMPERPSP